MISVVKDLAETLFPDLSECTERHLRGQRWSKLLWFLSAYVIALAENFVRKDTARYLQKESVRCGAQDLIPVWFLRHRRSESSLNPEDTWFKF